MKILKIAETWKPLSSIKYKKKEKTNKNKIFNMSAVKIPRLFKPSFI